MSQWFAPGEMVVTSASTDVRVGGSYQIDVYDPSAVGENGERGRKGGAEGIYRKIVPNELLSFTWQGKCRPTEETLVTVSFKDVEEGTEVTITHEHFLTAESRDRHEQGWQGCLASLIRFVEK